MSNMSIYVSTFKTGEILAFMEKHVKIAPPLIPSTSPKQKWA